MTELVFIWLLSPQHRFNTSTVTKTYSNFWTAEIQNILLLETQIHMQLSHPQGS